LFDKWRERHQYFFEIENLLKNIELQNAVIRYQVDGELPVDTEQRNTVQRIDTPHHLRMFYEHLLVYLAFSNNNPGKTPIKKALQMVSHFNPLTQIDPVIRQQRLYRFEYPADKITAKPWQLDWSRATKLTDIINSRPIAPTVQYLQHELNVSRIFRGITLYDLLRVAATLIGLTGFIFSTLATSKEQISPPWSAICLVFTLAPFVLNTFFNPVDRSKTKLASNLTTLKSVQSANANMATSLSEQKLLIKDLFAALGIGYRDINSRLSGLTENREALIQKIKTGIDHCPERLAAYIQNFNSENFSKVIRHIADGESTADLLDRFVDSLLAQAGITDNIEPIKAAIRNKLTDNHTWRNYLQDTLNLTARASFEQLASCCEYINTSRQASLASSTPFLSHTAITIPPATASPVH
jgi:hypothetical protein